MSTKKKSTSNASAQAEYEALMQGRDVDKAINYTTTLEFEKDALMEHKSFGLGIITRELSDSKIEVAFRTGRKVLIHKR